MIPNRKFLIIITDQNVQNRQGGVYNFYLNLKPLLKVNHEYHSLNNDGIPIKNKIATTVVHFVRLYSKLRKGNYDCLVLNTSLNINAVLRDSIFAVIAKILKVKVLIFWHGWNFNHENYLKFPYLLFTRSLLKADAAIVLYSKVEESLRKLGFVNAIDRLTTVVNKEVFEHHVMDDDHVKEFNIIFFSRVEIYKGIYELIEAYRILKQRHPKMKLTITGDGTELSNIKRKVVELNLQDVNITGYAVGDEKYKLLSMADVFVLPSYSEGMPGAVLEAMAVGLPIVVTPVGGINDFFEDPLMGSIISIKNVDSIVDKLENLYTNALLRHEISMYNQNYAKQNFSDEIVYSKLDTIMNKALFEVSATQT